VLDDHSQQHVYLVAELHRVTEGRSPVT
jgi:hypothetical protein